MTSASIMEMSKTGFAVQGNMVKTPPVNVGTQFSDAMDLRQRRSRKTIQKLFRVPV